MMTIFLRKKIQLSTQHILLHSLCQPFQGKMTNELQHTILTCTKILMLSNFNIRNILFYFKIVHLNISGNCEFVSDFLFP